MKVAQVSSTPGGCVDAMWAPVTHDLSCDATLLWQLVTGTNFLLRKIVMAAQQVKRRKRGSWGCLVVRVRGGIHSLSLKQIAEDSPQHGDQRFMGRSGSHPVTNDTST